MSMLNPYLKNLKHRNRKQPILQTKLKCRRDYTEAEREAEKRAWQRIEDDYLEQLRKDELEEAQRAAEEEKEPWPPVWKPIEESIQFKSGMIAHFVEPLEIEAMDDFDFFSDPDHRAYGDYDILNKLKRFFKLVRDTRGYDVDWVPPPCFCSPFRPVDNVHRAMNEDRSYKKQVNAMLECVVDKINSRAKNHGEKYELLKVEKIVNALTRRAYLITFSVELVSHGGVENAEKDVQAMVYSKGGLKYTCEEWRFKPVKPGEDEPSEDPDPKRKRKPPSRNQDYIIWPVKRFVRRSTRLSNAAVAAPAADPEPPKKKKTKTPTKT